MNPALQPFLRQLLFKVVAGNQHHVSHGGKFRRLGAFGHPVVEHLTGFIAMDIRAWQRDP